MKTLRAWLRRGLALFRGRALERDFHQELESHVQLHEDDGVRAGMTRDEARRQALARLGGITQLEQRQRERRGIPAIEHLLRDVRIGARSLRRTPGLTAVAILTLAIGIGATTAVFGFVNAVLLAPLPIAAPDEVVSLNNSGTFPTLSYPDYVDVRDRNAVFASLAALRFSPMVLGEHGSADRVWGYLASGNYFEMLGVPALLGRTLTPRDDVEPGAHAVAVLSHAFWQRRFGADAAVVGRTVPINGHPFTVVGVMSERFEGTERYFRPDLWVPMMMQAQIEPSNQWLTRRQTHNIFVIGRLRPGVTKSAAEASLRVVAADLAREYPTLNEGVRFTLSPPGLAGNMLRGPVVGFSGALAAVAAVVLLLTCTNLTGLLLARATDRQRRVAICLAIGAGRRTLIRQSLVESALVCAAATLLAVVLTYLLADAFTQWRLPVDFPMRIGIAVDGRVLWFAAAIAALATALVGVAPALNETGVDLVQTLKEDTVRTRAGLPVRDLVLALQMSLSLVLLFGALLVIRSLQEATWLDVGFNPAGVVTGRMDIELQGYTEARGRAFQTELLRQLGAQPALRAVSLASALPLSLDQSSNGIYVEGRPAPRASEVPDARVYSVWPNFFTTLETSFVAGRDFDARDRAEASPVAIVNQAFASQIVGATDVIGRRFRSGTSGPWTEIVGVVRTGKYVSLSEDPVPVVFYAGSQSYNSSTVIVARGRSSEEDTLQIVKQTVSAVDPALSLYSAGLLSRTLDVQMVPFRVAAWALMAFGSLTLLLVSIGTYALVTYGVARRTREICIRLAVGASATDVVRTVLGRTAAVWLAGACAGTLLALAVSPVLSPLLLGNARAEAPATFLFASATLAIVAAIACWAPTRRALTSDPAALLRRE